MDQLLAVSHECDFPDEANHRPRVTHCEIHGKGLPSAEVDRWVSERLQSHGSLYTLDEQKLRELAPDLILTQRLCDVCAPGFDSVEALAKTLPSSPRVLNLEPRRLQDILGCIVAVAEAMGHVEKGAEVCRLLDGRIAEVQKRVAGLRPRKTFIMEWVDPIFNSGHWNPELIELARGTAVLSPPGAYSRRMRWEDLRAADPEVVIIASCGYKVEQTQKDLPVLDDLPGWNHLDAVRHGRVFIVDGSAYFSRPGPRIVDSLEMLAAMIHPEKNGDIHSRWGVVRVYNS
jgi:iron complex transport system substrate-binding protein